VDWIVSRDHRGARRTSRRMAFAAVEFEVGCTLCRPGRTKQTSIRRYAGGRCRFAVAAGVKTPHPMPFKDHAENEKIVGAGRRKMSSRADARCAGARYIGLRSITEACLL